MSKIIVIGGGPAGMMAAIKAAEKHDVILIERNEKLGKKLYITGKGRCNVTSSKDISEFLIIFQLILIFYIVLYILSPMKMLLNFLMIEILN